MLFRSFVCFFLCLVIFYYMVDIVDVMFLGTQVFELKSSVALGRGVVVSASCPEVSPAQEGWVGSAFHQQVVRCLEPQVSSSGKWGRQGWDKVTDPLGPSSS